MKNSDIVKLSEWYEQNYRQLPWRQYKKPYPIWISETMLQQTTSVGVLPYYEKFMRLFPTVQILAKAPLTEVLSAWSGLGYYSRARNLHKCAQILAKGTHFPKTWSELIQLPGIGPYTSRAISSLAFEEAVGVLDGNVIRILTRYHSLKIEWWKNAERQKLQDLADSIVKNGKPSILNQAMMELGASLCRPQNPFCHLCPVASHCLARKNQNVQELPFKKPKRAKEIWLWEVYIHSKNGKVALIENNYLPFLKGQWLFPGNARKKTLAPKKYSVKHNITHHEIYVKVTPLSSLPSHFKKVKYLTPDDIPKINPSSLLQKTLSTIL